MDFSRYDKEKLLPILVNRTIIFFLIICLLTLLLYAAGTAQGFIDSTLFLLLRLYVVSGFFLAAASLSGAVLNTLKFLSGKKARYLLRAGGCFLLAVFGAATLAAVMFILVVSKGNAA